jgi:hypothetical protein
MISRIATAYLKRTKSAGWWVEDNGSGNGDVPLDIMVEAIHQIDLEYRKSLGRSVTKEDLGSVFQVATQNLLLPLNPWVTAAAQLSGLTEQEVLSTPKAVQAQAERLYQDYERVVRVTESPGGILEPEFAEDFLKALGRNPFLQ